MDKPKGDYPALVLLDGEMAGKHWLVDKDVVTLGRDDTCDIVIPIRQISRQHIRLIRQGPNDYLLEDLESKNGTWLNGNRVEGTRQLSYGDEIHVALKVHIQFTEPGMTAPATHNLPKVIPTSADKRRMHLDTETRQVFIDGQELDPPLSLPQYRLLELLYINNGRVCTREEVVNVVWPEAMGEGVSEQAIDALVRRLRDRLNDVDEHQFVVTVRGHGFRLDNPEDKLS